MKITKKEKHLANYFRNGKPFKFNFTSKEVEKTLKKVAGRYFKTDDEILAFAPNGEYDTFKLYHFGFYFSEKFVVKCARLWVKGKNKQSHAMYNFIYEHKFNEKKYEELLIKELSGISTSYDKKLLTRWKNLNK